MRKIILAILLLITFWGCDGIEDSIVDPSEEVFGVSKIEAPDELKYSGDNTMLNTSILFTDTKAITNVWVKVATIDESSVITYHNNMVKSDGNKYTVSIAMNQEMPSMVYTINYYFSTSIQAEKKISSHNFRYDNMQNNVSPVLSEANIPNQVKLNENFLFSVRVTDENGYDDVKNVFYELFKPNGEQIENSQGIKEFPLYDDGSNGDLVAKDSIYTTRLMFPSSKAETGTWNIKLKARDRQNALSNEISHNIVVVK
jgi:hypothetical protein